MIDLEKCLDTNYEKWTEKAHFYEKIDGTFQAVTYGDFLDYTRSLANYFLEQGLEQSH